MDTARIKCLRVCQEMEIKCYKSINWLDGYVCISNKRCTFVLKFFFVKVWDPFMGENVRSYEGGKGSPVCLMLSMPAPLTTILTATGDSNLRYYTFFCLQFYIIHCSRTSIIRPSLHQISTLSKLVSSKLLGNSASYWKTSKQVYSFIQTYFVSIIWFR